MRGIVIGLAVCAALWFLAIGVLVAVGRRGLAARLVRLVPDLLRLFRGLLGDPRVPLGSKAALLVGVAWLVSPIDLIPEFVPVLGPLDDALMAAVVLRLLIRRTPPEVIRAHWVGDEATLRMILRLGGVRPRAGEENPGAP